MLAIAFAMLVTVSAQGLFGGNNGFGNILALDALTHHGGYGGYGGYRSGGWGGYGHDDGLGDLAALSLLGGFGNTDNQQGVFGGNNGFSDYLALDALTHHGGGYGHGGYDSFGDLGTLALLGGLGNDRGNNNNDFGKILALDSLTHHGGYGGGYGRYGHHDSFRDLAPLALLGNNGLFGTPAAAPAANRSLFGNNAFGSFLALDALSHGGLHDGGFGDLGYLALFGNGLNNNNNNNLGNLLALDAISHHDDYFPSYPSVGAYPVSYPSVGAYSNPVSYPSVGAYPNPVSYPSVGAYPNPVSYPSVGAYSNPVSYPSVGATAPHSVSYHPVSVSRPVGHVGSMGRSRLTSSHLR